ncbi:MAG: ABC transporter substrate-binding protein [Solirubrobacterales bacterium]
MAPKLMFAAARSVAAAAVIALAAIGPTGCGRNPADTTAAGPIQGLSPTTPPAVGDTGTVTWATYRDVTTLDPIQAVDYPERTVITALCDSLLQEHPDGTYGPGLASRVSKPDPRTIVLTIDTDARFWDGRPVTPEDVAFSLGRNLDPRLLGLYGQVFENVRSISVTGPDEVTISLSRPDSWLEGELSAMPGIVLEKRYVRAAGSAFGTPRGGTMCTGAFKLDSWEPGSALTAVRNGGYWDRKLKPKAGELVFRGVPDDASLTSGLLTGEISGSYPPPLTTLDQLEGSDAVNVYEGPSFATDSFVISSLAGPLGKPEVRRGLSLGLDRSAYIDAVYGGHAQLPRTLANPGSWGYAREVFQEDWNRLPEPRQDVATGRRLVRAAGAEGETLVIGTSPQINVVQTAANLIRQAAEAVGLKVEFRSVSATNYIGFFTDAKAREGVDGFPSINFPDFADPASLYTQLAARNGVQNFSGFDDPQIRAALNGARAASDPRRRAALTTRAGDLIMRRLPWIPLALPTEIVVMKSDITGAPSSFQYMGGPWATTIGSSG